MQKAPKNSKFKGHPSDIRALDSMAEIDLQSTARRLGNAFPFHCFFGKWCLPNLINSND
jgi:hypothetical protein